MSVTLGCKLECKLPNLVWTIRGEQFEYRPLPDITPLEVARLLPLTLVGSGYDPEWVFDNLPIGVKRHFSPVKKLEDKET